MSKPSASIKQKKLILSEAKKWRSHLILALSAVVLIVLVGQNLLNDSDSQETEQESITATVVRGTIAQTVSASGQIESANYLGVTTSVIGIVKEVFVKEGDAVTRSISQGPKRTTFRFPAKSISLLATPFTKSFFFGDFCTPPPCRAISPLVKTTSRLVNEYDCIALEDLKPSSMKNKYLQFSINDVSWDKFRQLLTYKAEYAGCKLDFINPKNTSKECSNCGNLQDMPLSKRTYNCSCGLSISRDFNSSLNILNHSLFHRHMAGTAIKACEEVSLETSVKQEAICFS